MTNGLSPEVLAQTLGERTENGDIQGWLTEVITKNWEWMVAGGIFFVLLGTDVVAIRRDVLADGKVDEKDTRAFVGGALRILGSFAGADALRFALAKNPSATLATIAAGVVAGVGITKTIELGREVRSAKDKKSRLKALGEATAVAVVTGAAVGALELGALQIDPEAWLITNAGMVAVAATRPRDTLDLINATRNFLAK